ncbi:hypothetical protein MRB53_036997 [Persea americana]|nr:hypothetical protein MRB53_036997 [Persea americana]
MSNMWSVENEVAGRNSSTRQDMEGRDVDVSCGLSARATMSTCLDSCKKCQVSGQCSPGYGNNSRCHSPHARQRYALCRSIGQCWRSRVHGNVATDITRNHPLKN